MTDRPRRLDIAKVRVIGPPNIQVVEAITATLPASQPTRHLPSRYALSHVRVYLEVAPDDGR